MRPASLPPVVATELCAINPNSDCTYPLNILSDLTFAQQLELRKRELISPIHIHTPAAHIGVLTTVPPGQTVTALDVVLFLQSFATKPLDINHTFVSADSKERIRRSFQLRSGLAQDSITDVSWGQFISGQVDAEGPLGVDLLLGNGECWGFEASSLRGYSVVHLANIGIFSIQ